MAFIAYTIIAEIDDKLSSEDREEMDRKIISALGCEGNPGCLNGCPMEHFASTVVPTVEAAGKWLHSDE